MLALGSACYVLRATTRFHIECQQWPVQSLPDASRNITSPTLSRFLHSHYGYFAFQEQLNSEAAVSATKSQDVARAPFAAQSGSGISQSWRVSCWSTMPDYLFKALLAGAPASYRRQLYWTDEL